MIPAAVYICVTLPRLDSPIYRRIDYSHISSSFTLAYYQGDCCERDTRLTLFVWWMSFFQASRESIPRKHPSTYHPDSGHKVWVIRAFTLINWAWCQLYCAKKPACSNKGVSDPARIDYEHIISPFRLSKYVAHAWINKNGKSEM